MDTEISTVGLKSQEYPSSCRVVLRYETEGSDTIHRGLGYRDWNDPESYSSHIW